MFNGFTLWGKITIQKTLGFLYFFQKKQTQFQIQSHSAKFIFEEGVKNRLA